MTDLYPPEMGPTRSGTHTDRELTQLRRTKFWRRAFIGLGVLALASLLAFSAYGIYAIRTTQGRNVETLRIVRDCTQVGGDCYQKSQQRTAKAVGDIGAGNILAVVCALQVPDDTPLEKALDQVTACVTKRLAEQPPQ